MVVSDENAYLSLLSVAYQSIGDYTAQLSHPDK